MAAAYRRPTAELLAHCGIDLPAFPSGVPWSPADLPHKIRAARMITGLTKAQLGRIVDRSGQAVNAWELGRTRPSAVMCRRLEAVFRLPAGSLHDGN
jgi:DNA-binding XRE family transcriptional regulator